MVILWGLNKGRYPIYVAKGTVCAPKVKYGRNSIRGFVLSFGEELLETLVITAVAAMDESCLDVTLLQVNMV